MPLRESSVALNGEWGPDDSTGPCCGNGRFLSQGSSGGFFPPVGSVLANSRSVLAQLEADLPDWTVPCKRSQPTLAPPPSRPPLVKELSRWWWAVLGHPCCVFCFCLFCICLVFPSLIRMSPGVTSFAERRAHASGPSAQPCFLPQPWGLETHIKAQWRQCPMVPAPLPQVPPVSHRRTKVTSTVVRGTGLQ